MITFANNDGKRAVQRNILEMSRVAPLLWSVIWALHDELDAVGTTVEISSVFYPPGAYGSKSMTHPEFRAVDVKSRNMNGDFLPEIVCERIEERVNRKFNGFDVGMKACVYHVGTAPHFHLQVPRGYTPLTWPIGSEST